jgi:molybdopterin converting factor small subunit
MQITVKLYASFRSQLFGEAVRECESGATAADIATELGIIPAAVGIVLVSGRHSNLTATLDEGDTLSLMPVMGGG